MANTNSAIVLGAGFSFAAGLPLTKDLFNCGSVVPRAQSPAAGMNNAQVLSAYESWTEKHPSSSAEEWLLELYKMRDDALQEMIQGTSWSKAVRFALARLVELPPGSNTHYYFGICTPRCHPAHEEFWQRVNSVLGARVIVSLNYDILVEQALHSVGPQHRSSPRCYYGGFPHTQVVRKMTDVTKRKSDLVQLGNDIVLYKLHGSVNWAWEHHSPSLKIHDDVRAVFRHDDSVGTPAIIPPIPEKQMPDEFSQIWHEARKSLEACQHWLVCGYSLPPYDLALRDFFRSVLTKRQQSQILILAPDSDLLVKRWREITPDCTQIRALPGLPQAFGYDWSIPS